MTAYFKKSAESYNLWLSIFGCDRVEVLPPRSTVNIAKPGRAPLEPVLTAGKFYLLDIRALSGAQRQRLVQHLSRKWKLPIYLIEEWISDSHNGIPLIASDVVVAMGLFA